MRLLQSNQINDNSTVTLTSGTLDLNGNIENVKDLKNLGGLLITNGGSITVNSSNTFRLQGGTTMFNFELRLREGNPVFMYIYGGNMSAVGSGGSADEITMLPGFPGSIEVTRVSRASAVSPR